MSMDAGALAQMNYGPMSPGGEIGAPSAGFASRGKGTGLKRLNLAAISENPGEACQTPRTSRSHLLAGLRTAPKPGTPASAPLNQQPHNGFNMRSDSPSGEYPRHQLPQMPHTAAATHFPQSSQHYGAQNMQQSYQPANHVLAPPSMAFSPEDQETDPNLVAQLLATEAYLNQRQQQLQQQLLNLTGQQFGGMNFNGGARGNYAGSPQTPPTPQMGFYAQQLQNGVSPIPQELPGYPGVYRVFNPMTGQYTYAVDPSMHPQQSVASPVPQTPSHHLYGAATERLRRGASPIDASCTSPFSPRGPTPPKHTPSPTQQGMAPPPGNSNNSALRRNHKKISSLNFSTASPISDAAPRSARPAFPPTPLTGTFGPGQNRAGEHPTRQPRGPPPMEELLAAPTTKHEGSKNFATRQRRKAVSSLVRKGLERRGGAGSVHGSIGGASSGSVGSSTPVSETEMTFSLPSSDAELEHPFADGDGYGDDGYSDAGTGRTSDKSSHGSLRAAAIGAERKERMSGEAEAIVAGLEKLELKTPPGDRRQMPFMLLERVEKRKSYCG
ncbi:hypothetical protein P152DRAFT_392410 [Eremomyces bilateralis CBS 781.70]|uniref:Uncharacterized protein n=1 Tax=Eremomyces bilateralis CBS 781.70 TaxID=1392243 RepID=A0A6G1GBC9_9PEZI|nr:uncharacterized protein P152DRAFT_392410 [Eremomyces bilateralis CBS 781.70]KAF1815246.1 hypothetical protein P152DRAFT_392410 [Eremomyces bilateralis CBS 781.70]